MTNNNFFLKRLSSVMCVISTMTRISLASLICLCMLTVGVGNAWGQSTTYTSNVTFTAGTNGSNCTVIVTGSTQYDGMKLGTSSKTGTMTFTVPAGTTTIHIHAAGWNDDGNSRTLNISTSRGTLASGSSSMALTNDAGVNSNSPFTLSTPANASTSYYKSLSISGVTGGTATITITTSSKRAVVWGVNAVVPPSCTTSPTVTAASNSSVTATTATVSCTSGISSLGSAGCSITDYGFVIGTSANPTIGGSGVTKHQVGTTYTVTGTSFSKDLTGLSAETTYYVRPYATNGNGTAYGTQTSFTTPALPKYTVTLKDNDETLPQASAGASVTLPSRAGCTGYTFAGWTKTWVAPQSLWTTTAPTIIPADSYTPTANENLYPVYTKEESGGGPSNDYELYSGSITEGDYIIYYNGKAMNTTVISDRLQYEEVTPDDDVITTTDKSIIWHVAASGDYWTIYNADANKYAASTGVKNKAQMLADGTDDKSLWTVSGTSTYEFVNKKNQANSVNANLRNNDTYGFACYATGTGGALSLYKNVSGGSTTSYISVPDCGDPCEKLGAATGLTVETDFVQDGQTYFKFSWTPAAPLKEETTQKLCYGLVGQEKTCTVSAKHLGEAKGVASNLPAGEYEWSIQAIGDGNNYCDGDVVNGTNFYIYSITYNTNGGNTIAATSGTTLPDPLPTPTREHYNFEGWYTDEGCTQAATAGDAITQNTTLYAKWTAKTYTITLDANGGTFVDNRDSQTKGSATFDYIYGTYATYNDAPNLTEYYTDLKRDGYQFDGWVSAGSPWNKLFTNTGDRTIQAQWSKLYSITLSENGTTTELDAQTSTSYTLPTELTAGSCQDDTKELVGWSTVAIPDPGDKPTSNFYELGAEVTLAATQTFYAVFATAEGDGGSAGEITTVAIGDQVVIIQIDDEKTELTGFRPDKVITDNNNYGTYAAYSTTPSATLVWTVEEGANDGTFAFKNGNYYLNLGGNDNYLSCSTTKNTSSSWTVTESDDRAIVTNVEHNSRKIMWNQGSPRFASYAKNHGLNSNQYYYHIKFYKLNGGTTYSAYTTLCDTTKATITYDLNGGTGEPCAKTTVTKGEEFDLCDQTPTKEGYDFAGWTDGVNTYAAGATVTVNESTTFYAKWNAKTITITWDQNYTDCPEPIEMQYVYDSDENTMPEEPVREGFQFVGWFTGLTDGIEITEIGEENRPTDDVTYYAHWNELYSITFMASGQVYVVQEDKYLSGANLELPADPSAANYACDGYIFDGWSVTEKPIEEATKPVLVTNSTTIDADETYYAVWKKATTEGAGETIFYESFDDNDAGGGNDGNFNTASSTEECYADNAGWEGNKFYEADQCIKLGGSSAKGYITTPALSQLGGNATLSFKAAAWNGSSESTTLVLSIAGGGSLSKTSVTLTKGAWQSYEVTITGGTPSTRITFEGKNTSNSRFFLDEVKVTTSGSYNYTTSPSCGPTIVAKDGMWVTSANGQSVKVNVPIAIKSFTNNATITGTTANSNFVVTTLENIGNGEHNLVVTYTPNASNIKEDATITLTAKVGEETISTTTFTLNGRSLPDEFVIVAQYNDKWLAVPANMQSGADQYNGIEVTPNNELTQIPAAPSTTIYSLRGVADNRYEEAGTCVRLVGNGNKCLWGNAASTNTTIQNWTTLASTNGSNYEWLLTTSDGELYTIANPAHPDYNQGRILSNSGSKYGLYKGTTKFYILPVGCSSLPGNIQVTARRVDATFSWEGNASSMQIDIYTNEGMTEGHISNTATASPYYMTGLSESTQYWFEMTPNGTDDACAYTGSFKTTGPTIDVVEWQENAAVIFVDKDEELNPLVIIDGEVEHGVGTGSQATELFFSKYFEAHAENKLLAIYNGTPNTIYLTGYTIKSENGTLDLSQFGQTKGQIAPNEEIILVYFDATYSAASCAERQDNYETWNVLNDKSVLAFSGRGSIGLYKNDVLIDVIGSTFPSGELTKIGKSDSPDNCGTGSDVRLYVEGFSVNDQSSFFCYNGDNIKTPEVENDYAISTNRCLLIRKNSVTSGANAVANNKADAGATCGDLSTTFTTLCSEWSGFRIGGGKSSNEEIKDATCDGLGYVGGFDYNKYYKEYTNIDDDTYLELYTHDDATKEYTIPIDNLAQYSCLNLRFQLKQGDQVLTEEPVQVPIIVSGEKATNDAIFNAIVKTDGDLPVYNQSIERCKTCNVVVLSDATLTKAADGATNDVAEVYNMKVYPGGQVVVPASTEYTVNSLAFRRQEDEVSMANIQGTLNVKHTNGVYLDVRIDPSNWHYMTLPYDCRVGDVTFADGTPAVVNTDYLLGWYDGAYRAEHKTGGWTYITDNDYILKKGLGYIVALPGDGKVRREIRFPMANDVIAEDLTGKTVSGLYAYGGDKTDAELRPNHKGWNMIGSPYLYTYTTDIVKEPLQMGTLEHSPVNPWDGTWVRTGEARYIVEPIDNGWSGYRQTTISNLKPFTSYFIQVGGVKNGEEYTTVTPEDEQQILFAANSVARNASAPRKVAEAEVTDNHPVWYGVEMIAPNNEKDNTTLLISDEFTDGYDMMDDLVKMRGDYYQYYNFPVLASRNNEGEMAFNALPDSTAAKIGVPLNYYAATAGTYTIATDGKFDLEEVKAAMLYDATTAQYTNLLTDNYSFTTNKGNNTNRFTLFVTVERKKVPNITTGMDNLLANGQLSLIAIERTLVLSGLTENADIYVYDMNGKLVTGTHTIGDNGVWRTIVPATGVYFVRVNSANNQQTLRTIVK